MSNAVIPTVKVMATLYDQLGVPVKGANITMKLTNVERYRGYVVPHKVIAETDENGVAALFVWPNELGTEGSEYEVIIRYPAFAGDIQLHYPGDGHPHSPPYGGSDAADPRPAISRSIPRRA